MSAAPPADLPNFADVERAAARLAGVAHHTPLTTSWTLDQLTGCSVVLKPENLQRSGAFKFRGAFNALSCLVERDAAGPVLAYSSGNHAQAIALAGRLLDLPVTVVMPEDAPRIKLAATRGYGAEVVLYDPGHERREEVGARIAQERGASLIPPYDHADVIAGQGTATRELFLDIEARRDQPLDLLLVPCGGGGLLSGSALSVRALAPGCRIVGVEPTLADDAARSFRTKTLQTVEHPATIADGARTPSLGRHTFPLVLELVDDIVTVSERQIVDAMRFCWERLKLVVEPTGALALAALLGGVARPPRGARVGVLLSGGNVDLEAVAGLLTI